MRRGPAALAPLLAALLAAGLAACRRERAQPGLEYMPDMVHSVPLDSFAPNPVSRDRKTLQAPVAGTIPRGFRPFRYGPAAEEAERAGRELLSPLAADDRALVEGKALYETFCLVCHGASGRGDGPLVPKIPNPPSYSSGRVSTLPAGQLYHVISVGSGRMPSYASQLLPDERWKIVAYVQTLQRTAEAAR
jgi:mono/diheme cytochrome c family protein